MELSSSGADWYKECSAWNIRKPVWVGEGRTGSQMTWGDGQRILVSESVLGTGSRE